jgi:hypothetical protein
MILLDKETVDSIIEKNADGVLGKRVQAISSPRPPTLQRSVKR